MKLLSIALIYTSLLSLTSCVNVFADKPPATKDTDPIDYCISYIDALESGLLNLKLVPYALTVDQDGYREIKRFYCTKAKDADSEINAGLNMICKLKGGKVEEGGNLQWCTASDEITPLYGWVTPKGGEDVCASNTNRLFINAAPVNGEQDPKWLKRASDLGYRSGKDAGIKARKYEGLLNLMSGGI